MQQLELTGILLFFPWILKNTDLLVKGLWERFLQTRDKIQGLIRTSIEEHKKTYDPDVTRDFVDALITQWKKTEDPESSFFKEEGGIHLNVDKVGRQFDSCLIINFNRVLTRSQYVAGSRRLISCRS